MIEYLNLLINNRLIFLNEFNGYLLDIIDNYLLIVNTLKLETIRDYYWKDNKPEWDYPNKIECESIRNYLLSNCEIWTSIPLDSNFKPIANTIILNEYQSIIKKSFKLDYHPIIAVKRICLI